MWPPGCTVVSMKKGNISSNLYKQCLKWSFWANSSVKAVPVSTSTELVVNESFPAQHGETISVSNHLRPPVVSPCQAPRSAACARRPACLPSERAGRSPPRRTSWRPSTRSSSPTPSSAPPPDTWPTTEPFLPFGAGDESRKKKCSFAVVCFHLIIKSFISHSVCVLCDWRLDSNNRSIAVFQLCWPSLMYHLWLYSGSITSNYATKKKTRSAPFNPVFAAFL